MSYSTLPTAEDHAFIDYDGKGESVFVKMEDICKEDILAEEDRLSRSAEEFNEEETSNGEDGQPVSQENSEEDEEPSDDGVIHIQNEFLDNEAEEDDESEEGDELLPKSLIEAEEASDFSLAIEEVIADRECAKEEQEIEDGEDLDVEEENSAEEDNQVEESDHSYESEDYEDYLDKLRGHDTKETVEAQITDYFREKRPESKEPQWKRLGSYSINVEKAAEVFKEVLSGEKQLDKDDPDFWLNADAVLEVAESKRKTTRVSNKRRLSKISEEPVSPVNVENFLSETSGEDL